MNGTEMSIPKVFKVGTTSVYIHQNSNIDISGTSNKQVILDTYLKGLKNISSLTKEELEMFYAVQNVKFKNNKTLIIGYENNYINSIKKTLQHLKLDCNIIELEKNIELYRDTEKSNEFETVFNNIKKKVSYGRYDKIVLDITNLCLNSYTNTSILLKYLKSTNKDIMLIIPENITKFKRLFGEENANIAMEKKYIVYCGTDQTIMNRIMKILY